MTQLMLCSSRQENLERARGLLASRNPSAAYECYQRAVDISPAAAKLFIEVGPGLWFKLS